MKRPDAFFEISWEVCNMVGGIHTVLATKASEMQGRYGDAYVAVGPDIARVDEEQETFREDVWNPEFLESIADMDVSVRMGRWLIPGEPRCLLVNYSDLYATKDAILADYWERHRVDSLFGGWDYFDPFLFGHGAGTVIERYFTTILLPQRLVGVAQAHEWMSGAAVLYLKDRVPELGTVFTTHATTLGRALGDARRDSNLLEQIAQVDPAELSRTLGVVAKHSIEAKATEACDVFTTVSDITAVECKHLLGRTPDIILPNGLGDSFRDPALASSEAKSRARETLLRLAEVTTGDRYDRATTRVVLSGGRYEYANKGIDVFLDALGLLGARLGESGAFRVVAFAFFPADHEGPRRAVLQAQRDHATTAVPYWSTHDLRDEHGDPISRELQRLGLLNAAGVRVHVVHVPIYLTGKDPLIQARYYDLLPGADVTVFPSLYDPWGYTPLESAALGVPTITTDLTGFGRWVLDVAPGSPGGVGVVARRGKSREESTVEVYERLRALLELTPEGRARTAAAARELAAQASWARFAQRYFDAHDLAVEKARQRAQAVPSRRFVQLARKQVVSSGTDGDVLAHMRPFTVFNAIPEELRALPELLKNVWWNWQPHAVELYRRLDPALWEATSRDPALFLERIPKARLLEAARSVDYKRQLAEVRADFAEAMAGTPEPDIAYFSMEFGLAAYLKLYSGGLGILAGDHLKTASDLGLPLCAVTLAYHAGYFHQVVTRDGTQEAREDVMDFRGAPFEPVLDPSGSPLSVAVPFPRGPVHVRAWRLPVGRVGLYLLDTNHEANRPAVRGITARLYGGDPSMRISQELILGIGGFHVLRAIGCDPRVYHMNEGHSAFLVIARIAHLMQAFDLKFEEALEFVRQTTIFTTHTPVAAGHDSFPEALVRPYLSPFERVLHQDWGAILRLGQLPEQSEFGTTTLALRGSLRMNAVSRKHREVTEGMFRHLYPGFHAEEVPIGSVTNGVHVATWAAPAWQAVFAEVVGANWRDRLAEPEAWEPIRGLDPALAWRTHRTLRDRLVTFLKQHVHDTWVRRRENPSSLARALECIEEDALIIGFARRFAPYKRATLLFRDVERLARLLGGNRPAIVVFAGKAHPADMPGRDLLRKIVEETKIVELLGRVLFVENYDMEVSSKLVSGCDVWLNTPTRPLEASGTSGMKAAMNGCLNLSVGDGWWLEGYNGKNGWLLDGDVDEPGESPEFQDDYDGAMLYSLLEDEVLPAYFDRDDKGIPQAWVAMMKESIASIVPRFSSHRMVREYDARYYRPARAAHEELSRDGFERLYELGARRKAVALAWSAVSFGEVRIEGLDGDRVALGSPLDARVEVFHPELSPEDLEVQVVVADGPARGKLEHFVAHPLACVGFDAAGWRSTWQVRFACDGAGAHAMGVRVMPRRLIEGEPPAAQTALVKWL